MVELTLAGVAVAKFVERYGFVPRSLEVAWDTWGPPGTYRVVGRTTIPLASEVALVDRAPVSD